MPRWGMVGIGIVAIAAAAIFLFQNELAPTTRVAPHPSDAPTRVDRIPRRQPIVERQPADRPPDRPPEQAPAESLAEATTPIATLVLPALADSDPFVREELEPLGLPQSWLSQDDLVRRLAVFADNATRGELARRPLSILKPTRRFEVVEREGRLYADPRNVLRFDALLDSLETIDPKSAAKFLTTIEPLIEAAFQELGSALSASQALDEVTQRVIEMPRNSTSQELVQSKVLYEYKDPTYETLPPFEKQLLRLGAVNLDRLERYLRALRAEMRSAN